MYYENQQKSWFHRTFICGHSFSGQIKRARDKSYNEKHVHYIECQKCGKKIFVD